MTNTVQHKLNIEKHTLRQVTVFNDRAELKREFIVDVVQGENEIIIQNVSRSLHDDSVRVNGSGDAVIEEVQIQDRRVTEGEGDGERASKLREKKKGIEERLKKIEMEKTSITKRTEAIDAMLTQLGRGIVGAGKDTRFTADQEAFTSITAFFAFYDETSIKLREAGTEKEKEREMTQGELNVVSHELAQIDHGRFVKQISVLLDCKSEGKITLELVYQVWGARWNPLYDVRVDTKDEATAMQLSYYANVSQSTGEDWEGGSLILSTARPCLGGSIPELGTLDVSFYMPPAPTSMGAPSMYGAVGGGAMMKRAAVKRDRSLRNEVEIARAPQMMMAREAVVSEQTLSTQFSIARPVEIPSDGAQHKVTIGIVSLSPQFVHETVPSKNSSAFLTASCVNSSPLPFLAGQASVYLDGAFVAKTDLKAVSPGERFRSSLGVDPAVKIEYKPVHKYHEQIGLLSKSSSTVHEQKIVVKNTRADSVLLKIRDNIPRSTDEKIKVKVISPEQVERIGEDAAASLSDQPPAPGAKILPNNNLEWTVRLDKGVTQTLLIKFGIEHPAAEKIEFNERFE